MQKELLDSFLKDLAASVVEMDEKKAAQLAREAVLQGVDPYLAISKGLARGMEIVGEQYEKGISFIPELLLSSDAMYAGIDILKPLILSRKGNESVRHCRVVIGVVEGDVHDIGKNLVIIMLEADGFAVIDLGRDVPLRRFIETAVQEKADMICLSALMSTSMLALGDFIRMLIDEGVRQEFKVMVGGACISQAFANKIGADGYAPNAMAAVRKARNLLRGSKVER
jgi:dimethylamine corrinoid protein